MALSGPRALREHTLRLESGTVKVPSRLPALALRDLVVFPYTETALLVGRRRSLVALDEAGSTTGGGLVFLLTQRDPLLDDPQPSDLYGVGTIARATRREAMGGSDRVVLEGLGRGRTRRVVTTTAAIKAHFDLVTETECEVRGRKDGATRMEGEDDALDSPGDDPLTSLAVEVAELYYSYASLHDGLPDGGWGELSGGAARALALEGDRARFSHLVAAQISLVPAERHEILATADPLDRLALIRSLLTREVKALEVEVELDAHLRSRFFPGSTIPGSTTPGATTPGATVPGSPIPGSTIPGPAGPGSGAPGSAPGAPTIATPPTASGTGPFAPQRAEPFSPPRRDVSELERAVEEADLPGHAREKALSEVRRLSDLNHFSPEAAVVRAYVDWIVSLPWSRRTAGLPSLERARAILDEEHYGLEEVKERILDHVAVAQLVEEMRGPVLCVTGPPGVGKTSLARSVARALGRRFTGATLGGVRDEAEIRGHRRTYVGALPGRILQGMRRVGTVDPVFLIDEVDKMAKDFHGDPAAALLEVLDPEHNRCFTDHYLEIEYDLSDVFFVATANTVQEIPTPLRDRMELIRLPGYLDTEKREIAARFLWPRLRERHGLGSSVTISGDAIDGVVEDYTREAGVRELDRQLSRVARKIARRLAEGASPPECVSHEELRELLGPPTRVSPGLDEDAERVGIANGLAWTAVGGAILNVEVAVVPGSGRLRLTGTLGEVMRESAQAAVTYARSRAGALGLDANFHERIDLHVHIPEGATPKDGPSAGITIAVAIISALTDTPTRGEVATTGEITLRGRVLPVGGIKEKIVAAMRGGLQTVVLPAANSTDLESLPTEVSSALSIELVSTMDEVMAAVLGHDLFGETRAALPVDTASASGPEYRAPPADTASPSDPESRAPEAPSAAPARRRGSHPDVPEVQPSSDDSPLAPRPLGPS